MVKQQQGRYVQQQTSKALAWALAALAVVIVAAAVAVVVAISTQTAAVQEQDYRQCVTAAGLDSSTSAEDMATIANRCYSSVYDEETTP